jgi:hypothetical protein
MSYQFLLHRQVMLTVKSQQSTANSQQPTVNSQQSTVIYKRTLPPIPQKK